MNVLSRGLTAAACAAALVTAAAAPAAADTVTLRIEGDNGTLVSHRALSVPAAGTFPMADGAPCSWDSIGGAIEAATGGNWDRKALTQTIAGETHAYATNDWWHVWQNRKPTGAANCDVPLQDGDELLLFPQRDDAAYNPTFSPLIITAAPAAVAHGGAAEITVLDYTFSYATGVVPKPAAGVTVNGGGTSATTNAEGKAVLTLSQTGTASVQASAPGRVRSNVAEVRVAAPGAAPAAPTPLAAKDTTPPKASIASALTKSKRISAAKAPKLLSGKVDEAGGVLMVKLRLTRTSGRRCEAWSAKRERFIRRPKCGAASGWWWNVGDQADWEYQLPAKLPKGRYVLDVKAIDRSYNRDEERRTGENRVVFEVR